MRHLLIFLFTLSAFGQAVLQDAVLSNADLGGGAAAAPGITVDHWQQIEASDFLTSPPAGWSVVDGSSALSISESAERATVSSFNSSTDSGTKGLAVAKTADYANFYCIYTMSAKTSYSVGFWWKSPNLTSSYYHYPACSGSGTGDPRYDNWYLYFSVGDGIRIQGGTDSSYISVAVDTWYWVTVKYTNGGTDYLRIYNTSGSQVGSEVSCSDGAGSASTVICIGEISNGRTGSSSAYFDDFVVDYTDSTYPLGP